MTEAPSTNTMSRHHWALLTLFGVVMLLGGTDMTKVTVALPVITDQLNLGPLQSLWTADVYALAAGVALIPAAVLADRFGRRRIYLIGLVTALVGAVVAAAALSPEVLLVGRIGQGAGAALLIAGTVAIIRVTFPGLRLRALAYGVWTASFSVGAALGPLLGGGLIGLDGWRWVFWINVPVLMVCLIGAWTVLRESRNPDPPRLDLPSALYSAGAVGLLIAGLKGLSQPDLPQGVSAAAVGAGLLAAALFTIRQVRLPRPFLDMGLLRNSLLATSAAVIAATNGMFNGVLYLLTHRLQVVDGLSAVGAGVTLIPLGAASAAGGVLGPMLQRRLAPQHIAVAGLASAAAGSLLLAVTEHAGEFAAMVLLGMGTGMIMAIAANALMSSAPQRRTADAGAIQESAFAIGAGSGIAVLGVLSIHYGSQHVESLTAAAIYGPGVEAALGLGAFLYVFFALGAALLLLSAHSSPSS